MPPLTIFKLEVALLATDAVEAAKGTDGTCSIAARPSEGRPPFFQSFSSSSATFGRNAPRLVTRQQLGR
jgi:hypothetical protein